MNRWSRNENLLSSGFPQLTDSNLLSHNFKFLWNHECLIMGEELRLGSMENQALLNRIGPYV